MAGEEAIMATSGAFVIFIVIIWFLFIVLAILGFIFWIFMVVDVAKRKFKNENDKVVWILIVVLLQIIGAIIYYFVIKKPDKH